MHSQNKPDSLCMAPCVHTYLSPQTEPEFAELINYTYGST